MGLEMNKVVEGESGKNDGMGKGNFKEGGNDTKMNKIDLNNFIKNKIKEKVINGNDLRLHYNLTLKHDTHLNKNRG